MQVESETMRAESESMADAALERPRAPNWVTNAWALWDRRKLLAWVAGIALVAGIGIALLIPKRYESSARIMPPETSGSGSAIFAALAGRAMGGDALGGLAASLLGAHNTGALFVDLLRSGTVTGHLIDRFHLVDVYHKRYRVDAAKVLARRTSISQDKKSGVITLTVTDTDRQRARDMAQAYLDELNLLVNRTSTSSAHQERAFIERRLAQVNVDLERAQEKLSEFSSTHSTIDLREQTRATVDAGARLEGELIASQGELDSLSQIYGNENVRVRAAQARVADLRKELEKMAGSSAQLPPEGDPALSAQNGADYPPLRQLPRLAVPYSNLYRSVRVQETLFELLTQQYEISRIQEAKDIPVISVIDAPGIPEKKSFPPRALVALLIMMCAVLSCSVWLIAMHHWNAVSVDDQRRALAREMRHVVSESVQRMMRRGSKER